jgi:hypothetical protein
MVFAWRRSTRRRVCSSGAASARPEARGWSSATASHGVPIALVERSTAWRPHLHVDEASRSPLSVVVRTERAIAFWRAPGLICGSRSNPEACAIAVLRGDLVVETDKRRAGRPDHLWAVWRAPNPKANVNEAPASSRAAHRAAAGPGFSVNSHIEGVPPS